MMMDIAKRMRTNPAIIAYGLYLYFNSRSYRFASKSLESIAKRDHVSKKFRNKLGPYDNVSSIVLGIVNFRIIRTNRITLL